MRKKILVVDDEEGLRLTVTVRLKSAGYDVITAKDGVEGLEKARSLKPDLVLLDVMMPKIEGYDVCRLLKFDDRYKDIPVIIFSAKSEAVDKLTGEKVGADGYITKPFTAEDLLEKVRALIGE